MSGARLRLLDRADEEIAGLPRNMRAAVLDFMHKFRQDHTLPGLQFKALKDKGADERLFSARITDDYRALLLHLGEEEYLLVGVKHRKEAYRNLDRIHYSINQVTGGIEYVDLNVVESRVHAGVVPPAEPEPAQAPAAAPAPATGSLFDAHSDATLTELGVAEILLPLIRSIDTEEKLDQLRAAVPQLTAEVLTQLYVGADPDQVLEHVTRPQATEDEVDPEDYQAALRRPATMVSTDDSAVRSALGDPFSAWQVFLHPTQDKAATRDYNGPARVSGGPGTGKTILALHRVRHLAQSAPVAGKPILLTTFTKNLALDLADKLRELGGSELLERVDVQHVDAVAAQVLNENGVKSGRILKDHEIVGEWQALLAEVGERRWSAEFLAEEWSEVILGQVLNSRAEYFQARRPGRGQLRRPDRDQIWKLVERFHQRLEQRQLTTFRQRAERAARLEMARDARIREKAEREANQGGLPNVHFDAGSGGLLRYRYRHIVVDEAQDLNPAHWKMLRAMVAPGRNDLFIVGDTHQRIYENRISLGSLGINIRGRSSRLTLSYRTTRQILGGAISLLTGEHYDDLDGGEDTLAGYRSVLSGEPAHVAGFDSWEQEKAAVVEQVQAWCDAGQDPASIGVSAPSSSHVTELVAALSRAGVRAVEIGRQGPGLSDAVRVTTMHRCKGLEFQHMCVTRISEGEVPKAVTGDQRDIDRRRQLDRSLLFVAATRARDSLVITYHGKPSRFLHPLEA